MIRRLLVLLVTIAATGCTEAERHVVTSAAGEGGTEQERPEPGWDALPPSPLSPRQNASAFWTGTEVLIVGGRRPFPCFEECAFEPPPLRDGAAFDPVAGEWRRIARAPIRLGYAQGAVLGETLYLLVPEYYFGWLVREDEVRREPPAILAYDISTDDWRDLPQPPGRRWPSYLIATDDRLIGYAESHDRGRRPDLVFDPSTEAWTRLPADPLGRAYDRSMVWTGSELVLIGMPHPGEPWIARAAAFDLAADRWRMLPDPGISGLDPVWFWSSDRLVNPSLHLSEERDGGSRVGAMFDPATASWEPLPDPPSDYGPYRDLLVGGDEVVVSTSGWALHVPSGTWEGLPARSRASTRMRPPCGRGIGSSSGAVSAGGRARRRP